MSWLCTPACRKRPDGLYHDDVHGAADNRKHLTHHFAHDIRRQLASTAAA